MNKPYILVLISILILNSCIKKEDNIGLIEKILSKDHETFGNILKDPDQFEIQIIYTQIDRDSLNLAKFTTYQYHLDADKYFYPASTVKLPAAILALEKLNELGNSVNAETTLLIDSARESQSPAYRDSTSQNGLPSIGHYVKKILLVSDNDAFNRLYEFLGQHELNEKLWTKGFENTRISHRLSIRMSIEENQHTNPWRLVQDDSVIVEQKMLKSELDLAFRESVLKGKGYMKGDSLIREPMDFTNKNFFPLEDQHELLKALFFPEETGHKFNLTEADLSFLYRYMSMLPKETTFPDYSELPDNYVKFLMYGAGEQEIPSHIKIFNKVGQSYGYLTDNAYIIDTKAGVEFLLTAVIHSNNNQIFNDNVYEYDEVGFPFLENLGLAFYEFELKREKKYLPDFSRIIP